MLFCKKNFFNKLLIFSFIFLFFSIILCGFHGYSSETKMLQESVAKENTSHIQRQQETIISRLKRLENKIKED